MKDLRENGNGSTTAEEPDLSGTYTAKDYLGWTFEGLVELIRGKIYKMSPAPTSWHQLILGELHVIFKNTMRGHPCTVFLSPFDVYLVKPDQHYKETRNVVQPDLCIICDKEKIKKFGCVGTPDLLVEILSPSTASKDLKQKYELYEEYGVKEYWVVYPAEKVITIYTLENGRYKALRPITIKDKAQSLLFPELSFETEGIFKGVEE
jgi:Uma2 family endonuclease